MSELTFAISAEALQELIATQRQRPSFDEVEALLESIQPLVRRKGVLHYVDSIGPETVFAEAAALTLCTDKLRVVGQSHTLHSVGLRHSTLRATSGEVLAYLPPDLCEQIVAFETVGPTTDAEWNEQAIAYEKGWHVGITTWYARA